MKRSTILNNYTLEIFNQIDECRLAWPDYKPEHLFIGYKFLKAAADYSPSNITPYYAILYAENRPVAFFAFEVNHINLYDSLKNNLARPQKGFYNKLKTRIRSMLARRLTFKALVNGCSLTTGEYAFHFDKSFTGDKPEAIQATHAQVLKYLDSKGEKCIGVYMKDFFEPTYNDLKTLSKYNYTPFSVQPNMILDVREDWESPKDYLEALTSKYRVRNKRARKKAISLESRELTLEDLETRRKEIYEAYESIVGDVDFNLFYLHESYFYGLKKYFKDEFRVIGYFKEGELIGFYTYFIDSDLIEAHFLGCLNQENRSYHIYHNFLLDLVNVAIKHQVKQLILSRTALEIKSSVGAMPYQMYGFIRHRKKWGQWLTPRIFQNLDPGIDWIQRNPFKVSA